MAKFFEAKTPAEVKVYTYTPPISKDDGIASFSPAIFDATLSNSESFGDYIQLEISAGVAGTTARVVVTTITDNGETLEDTIYIPIVESAAQIANTARDYINFALRKIVGNGSEPTATESDDALEQLNAMLAEWRYGGADLGIPLPITESTVLYCPDWAVNAVRYNLRVNISSLYGQPIDPMDMERARRGLQLVKHKNLPDVREGADYF